MPSRKSGKKRIHGITRFCAADLFIHMCLICKTYPREKVTTRRPDKIAGTEPRWKKIPLKQQSEQFKKGNGYILTIRHDTGGGHPLRLSLRDPKFQMGVGW